MQPEWAGRPKLLAALNHAAAARLVTVIAPAGYGKSTLLALWHADPGRRRALAVLAVDTRDNDPVLLWSGILAALTAAAPGPQWAAVARLLRQTNPDIDTAVLPAMCAALASQAATTGLCLALDDCHLLTEPACHRQLAAFIAALPANCQLLVASRRNPPLRLARLRASGRLLEIGSGELRFGADDAAWLATTASAGTDLPADTAHALIEASEGWPVAVHLAARAMRHHADTTTVLAQLTARHGHLDDYITEEILDGLSREQAVALARTTVLERLTTGLAHAVAGDDLPDLDARHPNGLLLVPLDATGEWFRHHHLIQHALRRRLHRDEPHMLASLHRRAAAWLRTQDRTEDAIEHSLTAGDTATAITSIACAYMAAINTGRRATVRAWLDRLGNDTVAASAPAAITAAWVAAVSGDRPAVEHWLRIAEHCGHQGPLPDGTASVPSAAALVRAVFGFGGLKPMTEAAQIAVEQETDPTSPWYAMARTALGCAHYLNDESPAAIEPLRRATASHAATPMIRTLATGVLALAQHHLGQHEQAATTAAAAQQLAEHFGLQHAPQANMAYIAQAAVAAHQGKRDRARALLEQVLALRRRIPGLSPWPTLCALTQLAELQLNTGDHVGAAACITEARALFDELPDPHSPPLILLDRLDRHPRRPQRATRQATTLTAQEHALLRLLPAPMTLRQIAAHRRVSLNTIKTQTRAIYRKLGAANRAAAVTTARRHGLIP
ncbi:LuxR C-terminal-related transcriptional regulator [Micromonospora sp. KC721]|uniref:helix-turn-helix transcriptional regulator n=1 Tax=Micromonospora sp. KC721 TaxID=2530380 RepID=UPI001047F4F8|nr:LuxR C-terminal-related transcriptional regulator [Micromonospora sp. KC721]TDB74112.1 helix-turn-helix transcriptional regulator [Micromonospora sp. KC721]